jgi:hypothetical protein
MYGIRPGAGTGLGQELKFGAAVPAKVTANDYPAVGTVWKKGRQPFFTAGNPKEVWGKCHIMQDIPRLTKNFSGVKLQRPGFEVFLCHGSLVPFSHPYFP